jgi:hypothetical protein
VRVCVDVRACVHACVHRESHFYLFHGAGSATQQNSRHTIKLTKYNSSVLRKTAVGRCGVVQQREATCRHRPSFDLRVASSCLGVMGRFAGIDMPGRRKLEKIESRLDAYPALIYVDPAAPKWRDAGPPGSRSYARPASLTASFENRVFVPMNRVFVPIWGAVRFVHR